MTSENAVAVMAVFPDFQEWCRQNSTERDTAWLIRFLFCQKDAYFSEYLAYLGWCFFYVEFTHQEMHFLF
jgi:hypothetical protein